MSVPYGGPPGGSYPPMSGGEYSPPGRVNYGWIGEAFNLFGKAAGIWILGVLLYGITSNIVNGILVHTLPNPNYVASPGPFGQSQFQFGIQYGTNSNVTLLGQVIGLLFAWLFSSFQAASLYGVALKQVRGQSVAFGDLFSGGPCFVNVLLLNLALSVLYAAGIVALCFGALVVGAFCLPATALAADGRSVGQALSESVAGMKKDWLAAAAFLLVLGLVILASVIPCGLGLFATVPMVYLIGALAYRDMVGMPGAGIPGGQTAPAYGTAPGVWPPTPGSWPPPPNAAPPQWGAPPVNPAQTPQQYPGFPPQANPPQTPQQYPNFPPQQYPNFPPQQYPSQPAQEYPSEPPTQYPPEPSDEAPQNPWLSRPSPPPPPSAGE